MVWLKESWVGYCVATALHFLSTAAGREWTMIMFALGDWSHLRFQVGFLGWIHYNISWIFVKIFLKHYVERKYCLILAQEGNSKLGGCCGYSKSYSISVSPGLQVVSQHSWMVKQWHSHFKPQPDKAQLTWSGITPDPALSRRLLREVQILPERSLPGWFTLWSYDLHVKYQISLLACRRRQLELHDEQHTLMEEE